MTDCMCSGQFYQDLEAASSIDSAKKGFEPHPPMLRVSRTQDWSNGILTLRNTVCMSHLMHLNGSATKGLAVTYRLSLAIDPQ